MSETKDIGQDAAKEEAKQKYEQAQKAVQIYENIAKGHRTAIGGEDPHGPNLVQAYKELSQAKNAYRDLGGEVEEDEE